MIKKYVSLTLVCIFTTGLIFFSIKDSQSVETEEEVDVNSIVIESQAEEIAKLETQLQEVQSLAINQQVQINYLEDKLGVKQDSEEYLDYMAVEVPDDIKQICEEAGEEFGFAPEWIEAIIFKESRFDETVINGDCKGLMQVNVVLHADKISKYSKYNLWIDKRTNIYAGCEVLKELIDSGYEDLGTIMSLYHGEGNSDNYSQYTEEVALIAAALERSNGK